MNIVLFPGSFNPIHIGHLFLIKELLKLEGVDQVWISVTPLNPLKDANEIWPTSFRKELVKKSILTVPKVRLTEVEEELPFPLYTYNTLEYLKKQYPQHQFSLLVGEDNFSSFDRWYKSQELIKTFPLYIFPRRLNSISPKKNQYSGIDVSWLDAPMMDVSSSEIRNKINKCEPFGDLVPCDIEKKIIEYFNLNLL